MQCTSPSTCICLPRNNLCTSFLHSILPLKEKEIDHAYIYLQLGLVLTS
jgi:hypothetical protein